MAQLGQGGKRAAVCAALAALAVPTLFSALDRAAARQPALARLVPAPFQSQSLVVESKRLISRQHYAAAKPLAERAVHDGPIEPDSTALLGAARLGLGDEVGARRAFLVAGQLGWRSPTTQLYWMDQALAVGDYPVAAMRMDALMRQQIGVARTPDLLSLLEQVPDGREALADRLAARPVWLDIYASSSFDLPLQDALARSAVMNGLARRGLSIGCSGIGVLVGQLVRLGEVDRAFRTWSAHCRIARSGMLTDAGFDALRAHQATSPFEWVIIGDSDVSVSLDQPQAGQSHIVVASSAAFPRKVIMQLVPLPPGSYRLAWRGNDSFGKPSGRIVAGLSCRPDTAEALPATLDNRTGLWSAALAADSTCKARWLAFSIRPGNDAVTLSDVSLVAAR